MNRTKGVEKDRQLNFLEDLGYSPEDMTESESKERASIHAEVAADNEPASNRTEKTLLDQILSEANLAQAYEHVSKKGGAPGIDGMNVRTELKEFLIQNGKMIIQKIRQRKYKPKPVKRVLIPKDKPGEFRKLGIPTGTDRVIQQAVAQVLTPIYEEQFSDNSFGFRPDRGCQKALKRVRKYANQGYHFVVSIDLAKYFDTVPQMKLIEILQRTIKDNDVISLIHKFLKSGVINEGLFERTEEGMPQGGPLSPLLSNIMLNELDQELENRGLHFVRYADDTIILCKSRKAAERVMKSVVKFIEKNLKLKVNHDKSVVADITKIKYLGYGFHYDPKRKDYRFHVHEKSKNKFKTKIKDLFKQAKGMSYSDLKEKLNDILVGWAAYFCLCDNKNFVLQMDKWIRHHIRSLIWRRWKRVRTRYKMFRICKFSHEDAMRAANMRVGPWRASSSAFMHRALNNEKLIKLGFSSLVIIWEKMRAKKIKDFRRRFQEKYGIPVVGA